MTNRVVISVPRVLDSALVTLEETTAEVPTGSVPISAEAPFTLADVRSSPTETQMVNTVITPLNDNSNCARVTSDIVVPLTLIIEDSNGLKFETFTSISEKEDIVLFIPDSAVFPYNITSEGVLQYSSANTNRRTTTFDNPTIRVVTRVTAVTDLLIPTYGYAPICPAVNFNDVASDNFNNQPLFPAGKVY